MTTEETLEEIAQIADAADSCVFATTLSLTADEHKEALTRSMEQIRDRLKRVCFVNGYNPWRG